MLDNKGFDLWAGVYDEKNKELPNSEFIKYSKCAGIIKIWKENKL